MSRRRWIQVNGELVEVSLDYQQEIPPKDSILWNDRLYQDGNDSRFSSRSQHRAYMKANGLTTVDDYINPGGPWEKAERERINYGAPSADRKRDLIEAIHKLGG